MGRKRKSVDRATGPTEPAERSFAEWEQGLSLREKRLREVMTMMSRGAWLSGVSDELLAKKWNCDPSTVRHVAAEANRAIRMRMREDPEAQQDARAVLLQNIDVIRAKAMSAGDSQSLRVALDAMRAYGFYLGIEPAKKLEVSARSDPFEGWTTEEKLAFSRDGSRPRRALRQSYESPMPDGHALTNGAASNGRGDGTDGSVH